MTKANLCNGNMSGQRSDGGVFCKLNSVYRKLSSYLINERHSMVIFRLIGHSRRRLLFIIFGYRMKAAGFLPVYHW
jgi:hypothetical protein